MSKTDGNLNSGHLRHCDQERVKSTNLKTTSNVDLENLETDNNDSAISEIEEKDNEANICINNPFENSWSTWVKQI